MKLTVRFSFLWMKMTISRDEENELFIKLSFIVWRSFFLSIHEQYKINFWNSNRYRYTSIIRKYINPWNSLRWNDFSNLVFIEAFRLSEKALHPYFSRSLRRLDVVCESIRRFGFRWILISGEEPKWSGNLEEGRWEKEVERKKGFHFISAGRWPGGNLRLSQTFEDLVYFIFP